MGEDRGKSPRNPTNATGEQRISGAQACIKWAMEQNAHLVIRPFMVTIHHPTAGNHETSFNFPEGVFTAIELTVNQAYTCIRDRRVAALNSHARFKTGNKSIGLPGSTPLTSDGR